MKMNLKTGSYFSVLGIALILFTSCNKDSSLASATTDSLLAATGTNSTQAIAVATSITSSHDSVYVVNACSKHDQLNAVSLSSLPAAVSSYLTSNYSGYTFQKAFTVDSSGTTAGYIVIIQYNNKPVGLKFDASGKFISVLEQREGHDLGGGDGFHRGGMFDDRGGLRNDTIALNALPAGVAAYFASNYPQDTLVRAFKNRDSSIVVLSTNNGAFATTFTANGTFIKRMQLSSHDGRPASIAQSDLPAAIQTYLSATYPNYVFKLAFAVKQAGTLQGYVVFLDANNTKYAVGFDASGNFVNAVTVR